MSSEEVHDHHPRIDVSQALHEAGHEVHDLGFDGIADTGPVIHAELHPREADAESAIEAIVDQMSD